MIYLVRWLNLGLVLLTLLSYTAPFVSPARFWLLALLGLLAPWLLLANVIAAITLIYLRRRTFILNFLCLGVGWIFIDRLVAWPGGTSPADGESIRVVSLNTHSFNLQGSAYTPAEVADALRRWPADIFLMQEFPSGRRADKYANVIRTSTEFRYYYQPRGSGLAIFSRYRLRAGKSRFYRNGVNGFAYVDAATPLDTLRLYSVHLQSNAITHLADEVTHDGDLQQRETWLTIRGMFGRYGRAAALRAEQAQDMAEQLEESPYPVIVGGDFNDVPTSYVYQTVLNSGLEDAFLAAGTGIGTTYAGSLPGLRIDYLWSDLQLKVHEFRNVPLNFSDHRAVTAVFSRKE